MDKVKIRGAKLANCILAGSMVFVAATAWGQSGEAAKGDPNKYSAAPGKLSCRFFDGFADNGDGAVTDPRNGLIWKRCAEGMEWDGSSCTGEGKRMNWFDAMQAAKQSRFLGKGDWRLPSKDELVNVVGSSDQGCKNNDLEKGQYAASRDIAWPIDSTKSPGDFWSSSPYVGDSGGAWVVDFGWGFVFNDGRGDGVAVRLVRASQSSGGEAALEFNREYAKIGEYKKFIAAKEAKKKAEAAAKKRREEQEAKEREAERAKYEANACSNLYAGKKVSWFVEKVCVLGDCVNIYDEAIILGVGKDRATAKITGGIRANQTVERRCIDF